VGNLVKIWVSIPENLDMVGLKDAFRRYFGTEWNDVLDAFDRSFEYNEANTAYFAVCDLHPVKGLTLDRLLVKDGNRKPPNIIAS